MGVILLAIRIAAFAATLVILHKVVHRLYFHPLARFPGPLLAKLSDLHAVYYSVRGESHLKIWRAHQKYGPVVRLGPNKLMFNSIQALHDIYETKEVKKSIGYTALTSSPGTENIFNCVDKSRWRCKRRLIGPAFSDQAVRSFEPVMTAQLDIFLQQMYLTGCDVDNRTSDGWGPPVNLSQRCKWLFMDIMGDFGFGRSFQLQTSNSNRKLVDAIIGASKAGGVVGQYPRMKIFQPPKWIRSRRGKHSSQGYDSSSSFFGHITRSFFQSRTKMKDREHPDLFSFTMGKPESKTEETSGHVELLGEARLLILAGSDTTAAVLAATFFYLSRYPECYEKLVTEVRGSFQSADEIRGGARLTQLSYLRACIDETMRMSPPVGGALGREVLPGGCVIDGTFVAGGCDVGVALYCTHHDEAVFHDSFTYTPERWIESHSTSAQIVLQRRAFNPFSLGSRKCIAQTMAYTELSLALAKTLWYFDLRRATNELDIIGGGNTNDVHGRHRVDEFQLYEHFTSIHDGPYLEFKARSGVEGGLQALIRRA